MGCPDHLGFKKRNTMDKINTYAPGYVILYDRLKHVARQFGYCLAIHGSMIRDLDLVAIPWIKDAADAETLVDGLLKVIPDGNISERHIVEEKPHGRRAWVINIGTAGTYIDLSVMPKK